MFDKYLRAITDENERKEILALLRARIVALAVAVVALVALVVESVVFDDILANGGEAPMWPGYLTIALFAAGIIGYFVLRSVFWSKFSLILRREPREGEPEELAEYRRKLRAERTEDKVAIAKYSKFAIVGVAVALVLIVVESIMYPESEELGTLSYVGIGIFAVGLIASLISYGVYDGKKKNSAPDADICAKLDEMQGREHRYSLKEDKNAQSIDYLFPTLELRERAEKLKKNYSMQLTSTLIVASMMALCTVCVFCFGKVLEVNLSGYAYPIFVGMVLILTALASVQPLHYISKVEKEQLKELEQNPEYAKNLEIYRMYEEFSRVKGKTVAISAALSVLISVLIAVFVPDKPWSALCVIILIGGLFMYNRLYAKLRQSVIPLEKEIDELNAKKEACGENVVKDGDNEKGGDDFFDSPGDGEVGKDDDLKL